MYKHINPQNGEQKKKKKNMTCRGFKSFDSNFCFEPEIFGCFQKFKLKKLF